MNLFKYFDNLLEPRKKTPASISWGSSLEPGKRAKALLAFEYSKNIEQTLEMAYARKCASNGKAADLCGICHMAFSKNKFVQACGTGFYDGNLICKRCDLKNTVIVCEECKKYHIVKPNSARIMQPILVFQSIELANNFFPEAKGNIVPLDYKQFEKWCKLFGFSEYFADFAPLYGKIVCAVCSDEIMHHHPDINRLRSEMDNIGCKLAYPTVANMLTHRLDDSGLDVKYYTKKINDFRIKANKKLRILDAELLESVDSHMHMNLGLSQNTASRFSNASSNKTIDTAISVAKQMLNDGIKNSVEEFTWLLLDKLRASAVDSVMEYTQTSSGGDVLIVVPTNKSLDENIISEMFMRQVVNKAIKHPYGMDWQKTKAKKTTTYQPAVTLDSLDVDFDGDALSITASLSYSFN